MANLVILLSISILINTFSLLIKSGDAQSYCNGQCETLDDCSGQLICINGECNDDPDVGTNICGGASSDGGCQPYDTLTCDGISHPKYSCSPPVTGSTPAKLTLNDFSPGGDGGGASECDGQYHDNGERIVALSTGWYAGGSRCLQTIRITAGNGWSTTARVVDECDSQRGCDEEHAYQPPCRNNIVDGSDAVWKALGLNEDWGVVDITWSMA
ncbi:hypothetical protein DH2020_021233 [Rehmannia glutinosa]|uniref:Kiwellin n=1 Tax=Rehmannia glutinosa TaxID=99300 RepID=A0ABR0W9T9_REHGL